MFIALQSLVAMYSNLLTDIRIARETGHAGIEINGPKLRRYLAQGYTLESLLPLLKDVPPVGICYLQDIERQESAEFQSLLEECESICVTAEKLGCPMVQLLTGPLDPEGKYQGLTSESSSRLRKLTARNLQAIGKIGKKHKVKFFLEALTWTPLHKLEDVLATIDAAEQDNVGLVIERS